MYVYLYLFSDKNQNQNLQEYVVKIYNTNKTTTKSQTVT